MTIIPNLLSSYAECSERNTEAIQRDAEEAICPFLPLPILIQVAAILPGLLLEVPSSRQIVEKSDTVPAEAQG